SLGNKGALLYRGKPRIVRPAMLTAQILEYSGNLRHFVPYKGLHPLRRFAAIPCVLTIEGRLGKPSLDSKFEIISGRFVVWQEKDESSLSKPNLSKKREKQCLRLFSCTITRRSLSRLNHLLPWRSLDGHMRTPPRQITSTGEIEQSFR
ncbi:MAG: hypothetical protein MR426_01920, partial [Clostridiales bacterium]|nr:hypothetical protein [Clostridiales bacterium]